ncbi:DUF2147 domain-containing protein [Subsaximicrobium wynnwilliamsii]|uniref:DUF2147 domain-containing protein n=1 Tax=Subsaximicrobium wynnwilliamsii TaxID=291179 RepID=A0A5C6ZM80_9FLAO|nr:DUF2147 domain-containing protein [Subsaximicrobium wynnwilliamsii]TXD81630.1 DUF2147 domain-containing protein [Subsaximicrobium wynnwilliamsii]TXD91042.1 DUF2147 domain-containing protein [Subsaximicrobium wynnwilliamsii]TXE01079.1 DUF2147 domain-containing protein [Subsaximicrobium wynnwilliamsii]
MNKPILSILAMCICSLTFAQEIFGNWKTIDDETGKERSIVNIYKENGKVYGKIVEIFDASKRDLNCVKCEGEDYNKPVLGLIIIKDMEKDEDAYREGTITNPDDGKVYDCRLKLTDDPNELQVRGYVAFFYKTQYWVRADK